MDLTVLLYTGIIIATGLLFGKVAKYLKLPNVTGYLVGGLLIGPSLLNIIKQSSIPQLELVSVVALGFIAFSIGSELKIAYFKKVGTKPIVIAVFEATFAVVFVFGALLTYFAITKNLTNENLRFSLILASIAAATAPAATLMVIRQYKAKGKLTDTLMSVVAIDDSIAVILFGIGIAIANAINPNVEHSSLIMQILFPMFEILVSLGIGIGIGIILVLGTKWFTGRGNRISLVIVSVFLSIYLADALHGSSILACMAVGAIFANFSKKNKEVHELIHFVTPPIYIMFFVLSGIELELSVLKTVGMVGLIYVLFRVAGKVSGAGLGAKITHQDSKIAKYLGITLVPQAGVAIGLSLIAAHALPDALGSKVRAIILAATVIFELTGPIITKIALKKAGEISQTV
ncbi:MAG: cation:proton antiporter [Tenericutes bacterium]|nr:cation:proton antiporter [Mycoplasmatota bacterium]